VAASTVEEAAGAYVVEAAAASALQAPASSLVRPLGTLQVLPTRAEIELSLRLVFAGLGGAAVGLERSSSDRPAGVRTMALVSLGAAAFTLCSMYGFMSVGALVGPGGPVTKYDPSRMASNVASGVGFIGAGVITNNRKAAGVYDRQSTVGGLTTAAAIWVSAAIGVANGVGLYFIGASAAISTIAILRFGHLKHGHFWGGRDVTVGTKKKKKADALLAVDGDESADGSAMTNAAVTIEGNNAKSVSKSSASFAGDSISKPKHGMIDARLEEMSKHEESEKESLLASRNDQSISETWQYESDEDKVSLADHSIKIKAVGGIEIASNEGSSVVEEKASAEIRRKEKGLTLFDAPPLPPPSTADPLLEKYLWGVDNLRDGKENESRSYGQSSRPNVSIEEDQELVFRDSNGGKKTRGEGKERSP